MAKGIVLPSGNADSFKPLTYQTPIGMLPIVNKPLVEHQVELYVRFGIRQIMISCNHLSNRVESYFATGSRWGASISYNFERPPFGSVTALRQMKPYFQGETLLIMHSDIVSAVNLEQLLEYHKSHRADATFVCRRDLNTPMGTTITQDEEGRIHSVTLHKAKGGSPHPFDAGICVFEPELLDVLGDGYGYNLLQHLWLASQSVKLNLFAYVSDAPLARVTDWNSYYTAQKDILEGSFDGILVPGLQVKRGVWVGKNVNASSNISFEGPIIIGDNCRIGRGVTLGKGTIIGHDVIVDVGASMNNSMIMSKTFVGPQASIQNSVLLGNLVIDLSNNSFHAIEDSLTALEIRTGRFSTVFYHFLNKAVAGLLCVFLSPLLLTLMLLLVLGIKFPVISRVRRIGVDIGELAASKLRLRVFDLYFFGPIDPSREAVGYNPDPLTLLPHIFSRLANIFNVLKGDLLFVGNRPMDPELAFSIAEEWRRTRFKCQSGMISVLDTNEAEGASEEEQIIAEGYYAVNRTLWVDLRIVLNALVRLFGRILGKARVKRESRPVVIDEEAPSFE